MGRLWRVYHPGLEPPLDGAELTVLGDEARHVSRVLRLEVGEPLAVFDGRGNEWLATIVASAASRIELRVDGPIDTPVEAPLALTLYQGQCKPDRMEWVVQKATELGFAAVRPVASERAERGGPSPRQLERLRRIAVEACKQCGRRVIPRIEPIACLPQVSPGTIGFLLDPVAADPLDGLLGDPQGTVWIAVGPEGGFTEAETRLGSEQGWRGVGLGPRILRTDTAGLVAAAIVLHRWGDLGRSAPR